MRTGRKVVVLIPIRAGSRRIPDKHTRELAGFCPAVRIVNSAVAMLHTAAVYVATNDDKVKHILRKKPVIFFNRSEASAAPEARTEVLIDEFANQVKFDDLVLIQATNVFVNAWHLNRALDLYRKFDPDTLASGVVMKRYFFTYNETMHLRTFLDSETRPGLANTHGLFVENGAFWMFKREGYLKHHCLVHGVTLGYEMPLESFFELDTETDWKLIEAIVKQRITYANTQ